MSRHKPYTIKIELVRGCTMRCPFCALPEMEWADDPWKFMDKNIFGRIVEDLANWLPKTRIEFAERGEQTFHPELLDFIHSMRGELPLVQITITSNGDTLKKFKGNAQMYKDWVYELFDAGLNIMMLDCYTSERYESFKQLFPEAKLFYEDDYHPYRYMGPKEKTVLLVDGTYGNNHKIRRWHNAAGNVNVEKAHAAGYDVNSISEPLEKMCVRPFREMEIHVDGTVPLCCNDWKRDVIIGNVSETLLEDLWEAMDPYRSLLLQKDRAAIASCKKCSERAGFRVGLEMRWFEK